MTLAFPGEAAPAVVPLQWEAWTRPRAAIRFPGEAPTAATPLRWADWVGTPPPLDPQPESVPEAAAQDAPEPTLRSPRPSARTATHPAQLLGTDRLAIAMSQAHAATTSAHGAFLDAQHRHLATLETLHQRLAALGHKV